MRHIATIITSLLFGVISCNSPRGSKPPTQDTPKALGGKPLSELVYKSRSDDLVDNIYTELVDKSPELKDMENKIAKVQKSKSDSLSLFDKYDDKNHQFYSAAGSHLSRITDSLLRQQIKSLLDNSLKNYKTFTQRHNDLLKTVDLKAATLNDIHIILKLYETLPVIEEYQKTNLPATTPIENLINDYDKTIQKTESLTKKQNGS
jgi:hypothetical protein